MKTINKKILSKLIAAEQKDIKIINGIHAFNF